MKELLIIKTYILSGKYYDSLKKLLEYDGFKFAGGTYKPHDKIFVSLCNNGLYTVYNTNYSKILFSEHHEYINYDKLVRKLKFKKLF